MDFAAVIPDLRSKLAKANERLANLGEKRRPFALDAVIGGAKARRAIEKIDADVAAARNESETLTVAIEEAEKRKADHEAQIDAAIDHIRKLHGCGLTDAMSAAASSYPELLRKVTSLALTPSERQYSDRKLRFRS